MVSGVGFGWFQGVVIDGCIHFIWKQSNVCIVFYSISIGRLELALALSVCVYYEVWPPFCWCWTLKPNQTKPMSFSAFCSFYFSFFPLYWWWWVYSWDFTTFQFSLKPNLHSPHTSISLLFSAAYHACFSTLLNTISINYDRPSVLSLKKY